MEYRYTLAGLIYNYRHTYTPPYRHLHIYTSTHPNIHTSTADIYWSAYGLACIWWGDPSYLDGMGHKYRDLSGRPTVCRCTCISRHGRVIVQALDVHRHALWLESRSFCRLSSVFKALEVTVHTRGSKCHFPCRVSGCKRVGLVYATWASFLHTKS